MHQVICTYCGEVYDLAAVTVIARFADCSTFETPCCGHDADDRTWVSLPSFREMDDYLKGMGFEEEQWKTVKMRFRE